MSEGAGDGGVTVVVRRRVRPEAAERFEAWLEGIAAASARFPGHAGAHVVRPAPGTDQDYVVVFRFDSADHLAAWEGSDERARWLAKGEPLTEGTPSLQKVTGLEFWFARPVPPGAASHPPPRWKMATVTIVGLFPLILLVAPRLRSLLIGSLNAALTTLVVVAVIVALMTWLVMPILVRLAAAWLYPEPPSSRASMNASRSSTDAGGTTTGS